MNIFDISRFAAAVIGTLVLVIILIVIGKLIFDVDEVEQSAFGEIETTAPAAPTAAETAAEPEAKAEAEAKPEPEAEAASEAAEAKPEATAEAKSEATADAKPEAAPAPEPEATATLASLLAQGSVEAGQRTAKRCTACHTFDEGGRNGIGPNLWGVLGSPRAANADYKYSGALAEIGGDWGYAELDAFLTKPRSAVPGTKMSFSGIRDAQDRASIILYLRSVSGVELPLPPSGE